MSPEAEHGRVVAAFDAALADVTPTLQVRDFAAVELARRLAAEIDAGGELHKLAPQLTTILEALLMTPRARAAVVRKGAVKDASRDALDEIRERRRARQHGAAAVDQTTPGADA